VSAQGNDRQTKAERKEQARIEREEIQRKQAARKRNRTLSLIVGLVIGAVVVGALVLAGGNNDNVATGSSTPPVAGTVALPDPATLPGIMRTPPPWSNNVQQAAQRVTTLGLPGLSDTILHHHVRLWVYVDGQQQTVPGDIGLSQTVASPLHTHDESGLVHVESDDPNFAPVLGQFMDVWGLYMTQDCLGDACASGDRQLRIYVDGKLYAGDPAQIPLDDQIAIVVTMGTQDQLPDPIPDSFTFTGSG
jgi:hypothetical protein